MIMDKGDLVGASPHIDYSFYQNMIFGKQKNNLNYN